MMGVSSVRISKVVIGGVKRAVNFREMHFSIY
jgi:hypothetical protein